jgi:hypothetical protein
MKRFIVAAAALLLAACVTVTTLPHRDPAASWDQANLKINDHGCPSAIFVAPGGNLVQCETPDKSDTPQDDVKFFPTTNAAALYIVGKIYEHSHYFEYGGVIVKSSKGYALSAPKTQRHGMDVAFNEDPEAYEFPIVASYHVHPCLSGTVPSVFSPQDLAGARVTNHPAYVLDECTGALHYWAPGDGYMSTDALLKLGVGPMELRDVQVSSGKIVGHIVVDGVLLN